MAIDWDLPEEFFPIIKEGLKPKKDWKTKDFRWLDQQKWRLLGDYRNLMKLAKFDNGWKKIAKRIEKL